MKTESHFQGQTVAFNCLYIDVYHLIAATCFLFRESVPYSRQRVDEHKTQEFEENFSNYHPRETGLEKERHGMTSTDL